MVGRGCPALRAWWCLFPSIASVDMAITQRVSVPTPQRRMVGTVAMTPEDTMGRPLDSEIHVMLAKRFRVTVRPIFCPKHLEPSHGHEVTRSANPAPLTLAGQHGMFIKRRGSRLQAHKGIATAGSRDGWGHERVANSDA